MQRETTDTTITDFVVGGATAHIKTGAPSPTERVAKHKRLFRVEEKIRAAACFEAPGVTECHDLHVWTITSGMNVVSDHVIVEVGHA